MITNAQKGRSSSNQGGNMKSNILKATFEGKEESVKCGWCNKGYRFEFNWIDNDGNTVTTKDHYVIG